jgi:FkbH-like protein
MNIFVFRNHTVEPLFSNLKNVTFSEYGSVYIPDGDFSLLIWCYFLTPCFDENEILKEIDDIQTKLHMVSANRQHGHFLLFTLDGRYLPSWQLSVNAVSKSISAFNNSIYDLADNSPAIKIVNIVELFNQYKLDQIVDKKYYYLSKIIINPLINKYFHTWFESILKSINGVRKKCLVLDLDNTMWGGILGEDGITGIKLGNTYPGSCFVDFQKQLKEAKKNGVLLAICSKNNEDDVWEAFENHPDMILKKDDFVSFRINWNNKAANIREIAAELNIGIDSIVFIDDNPVERGLVGEIEPDVILADFPEKSYEMADSFQGVYNKYFRLYKLTKEDTVKTEQYKANSARLEKSKVMSINDYLLSLNTVIKIDKADTFNIPRIAQLTQKTNQFNLTTKRYSEPEIVEINSSNNLIFCASVSDKFGDNGITAAGIILTRDSEAEIDSYMLSCRILGREVEFAIIKTVLNSLFVKGVRTIKSTYIPTLKNRQTENFYDLLGFSSKALPDNSKEYLLEITEPFTIENLFTINLNID